MNRYILLLTVSLIWGASFTLNEWAIEGFSPLVYAFTRIAIGCLCLTLCLQLPGMRRHKRSYTTYAWVMFFLIGLFEATLPLYLVAWGQLYITSAIAAILMGLAPVFVMLLANLFVPGEHLNRRTVYSVVVGFLGLAVLLSPKLGDGLLLSNIAGELATLGAALSFAVSVVLIKSLPPDYKPMSMMRNVLLCSVVQLLPLVLILDSSWKMALPSTSSLAAVIAAGILPGSLGYLIYLYLVKHSTATFSSMINFLVPLVGVALGVCILDEDPVPSTYAGLAMILSAVAAMKPVAEGHT